MECELYWQCQQQQLSQCLSQSSDCENNSNMLSTQKNSFAISKDSASFNSQGAENLMSPLTNGGIEQRCRDDGFGINDDTDTLLQNPTDFAKLLESMDKCKKGVLFKTSVSRFYLNGLESCIKLEKQLKDGSYKESTPYSFTVTYPKRREIVSITFRDRVYQRSLNDNAIYPKMTKPFIWHNFACQKGKGTDLARKTFKHYLEHHYRKYKTNGYIFKFDIKGYYNNLSKQVVLDCFSNYLDSDSHERAKAILLHQYKNVHGFNPGSQIVQIAGISALDKLDHYIKEELKIKSYLRYMDDGILIHPSKEYLEACKTKIESFLNTHLELSLHQTKSKIIKVTEPIRFLGFIYRLTESGKVAVSINPQNVKHEKRKLKKLVNLAFKGIITKEKVDKCYMTWKSHASKSNCCFNLLKRMDLYYNNLWRNIDYDLRKK